MSHVTVPWKEYSMPRLPAGTVTFLFTDVDFDPVRLAGAGQDGDGLGRQDAILRRAIEANGGYAYKTVGHAIQAAFSTAPQAVAAAVEAQRELWAELWEAAGDVRVRVRMALH